MRTRPASRFRQAASTQAGAVRLGLEAIRRIAPVEEYLDLRAACRGAPVWAYGGKVCQVLHAELLWSNLGFEVQRNGKPG